MSGLLRDIVPRACTLHAALFLRCGRYAEHDITVGPADSLLTQEVNAAKRWPTTEMDAREIVVGSFVATNGFQI